MQFEQTTFDQLPQAQPLSQAQQDVKMLDQLTPRPLVGTTEEKFAQLQKLNGMLFLTIKDLLNENNELTAFIKSHLPIAHTLGAMQESIDTLSRRVASLEENVN